MTRSNLALGGEEKRVTILFCDLRDFTSMSEHMRPGALLELLNEYFGRMSRIVDTNGGVVDKYIGDALMALFGAPVDTPDQADFALCAALEMQTALAELNAKLATNGCPTLRFGIGIDTATVVAGNIGSPERYNYTVIGDGVNTAARLQSLTRKPEFEATVILSDATLQATRRRFRTRPLGEVIVKGRYRAIAGHELLGLEAATNAS